jgi:predicted DNA-binding transcriptional regulator AlpA
MRFLTYKDLRMQKGIPYSDRQLRRLEAEGKFPRRTALVAGGSLKGWIESSIDTYLEGLTQKQ